MNVELKNIDKFIVVADRLLIKPQADAEKTTSGLYLPAGVKEKEKVRGGYVVKVGPGYPLPDPNATNDEPWSSTPKSEIKYIPPQAQVGDYAIFLSSSAIEIEFEGKKYVVVPQSAILVLVRDNLPDFDIES